MDPIAQSNLESELKVSIVDSDGEIPHLDICSPDVYYDHFMALLAL
jgi:hypothetical protein